MNATVVPLWLPVLLIAAWWFASADSHSYYFPALSDIVQRFRELWLFADVRRYLLPSLLNLAVGFTGAVAIGVVVGVVLGLSDRAYQATRGVLEMARATPHITLVPIAIIFFGVGSIEKIVLIAIASVWPVLLNTSEGVRQVDPMCWDVARSYRMSRPRTIAQIIVPAASPRILAGTRVAVSIAILMMVGSELYASVNGIGYFVLRTQSSGAVTDMWTAVTLLGLLGYVISTAYGGLEFVLLRWHRGWRAANRQGG